jgi:hypothetical protein
LRPSRCGSPGPRATFSALGLSHSRLRLTPIALVLQVPAIRAVGIAVGHDVQLALLPQHAATGSAGSHSTSSAPSIHHSAIDSPGAGGRRARPGSRLAELEAVDRPTSRGCGRGSGKATPSLAAASETRSWCRSSE